MNRVRSKHAMPTMIRRLESFKVTDLSDVTVENKSLDSVERFISDVAYGWTRRQITCSESIELYKGLFKRITSEQLVVPPALLSTWLSLIARQTNPKLEEVKSLKLFQMPPKNHRENLISFVPQLLEHLKTATDLPRKLQFDQTVEYLVGLSKTSNDTKLLLEEHSKLPTSIASSRGWSMLLAKYCSERNSELEFVVDMIQIMILRDNIYPMKVIAPVLRQLYVKTRPDKTEYTHFGEETMLMDIIIRCILEVRAITVAIKVAIHAIETENYMSAGVLGDLILEACRSRTASTKDRLHLIVTAMPNLGINIPIHLRSLPSSAQKKTSNHYSKSPIVFARTMEGLYRLGFENSALRLYNSLSTFGFEKGPLMYVTIIKCLLRNPNIDLSIVYDKFEEMKRAGYEPGLGLYVRLIQAEYTAGEFSKSKETLKLTTELHAPQAALYALAVLTDSSIYGLTEPSEMLQHMESKNIKPTIVFFQHWLEKLSRSNDIDGMATVYQMAKENFPETPGLNTSLIEGYLKNFNIKDAEKALEEMKKTGPQPGRSLLTSIMKAYMNTGELKKSLLIYGDMIGYSFAHDVLLPVKHSQRPDTAALLVIIDPLLQQECLVLLEYVYRKTLEAGYHVPLFRAVPIVRNLLEAGYVWPIVLASRFKDINDVNYCVALVCNQLKNTTLRFNDNLMQRFQKYLEKYSTTEERSKEFHKLLVRLLMKPKEFRFMDTLKIEDQSKGLEHLILHIVVSYTYKNENAPSSVENILSLNRTALNKILCHLGLDYSNYSANSTSEIIGGQTLNLRSAFQFKQNSWFQTNHKETIFDYQGQINLFQERFAI